MADEIDDNPFDDFDGEVLTFFLDEDEADEVPTPRWFWRPAADEEQLRRWIEGEAYPT